MNCGSGFPVESFQLMFLCFHLVKHKGVPRGRMCVNETVLVLLGASWSRQEEMLLYWQDDAGVCDRPSLAPTMLFLPLGTIQIQSLPVSPKSQT